MTDPIATRIAGQIRQETAMDRAEDRGRLELLLEQVARVRAVCFDLLVAAPRDNDAHYCLAVVTEVSRLIQIETEILKLKW